MNKELEKLLNTIGFKLTYYGKNLNEYKIVVDGKLYELRIWLSNNSIYLSDKKVLIIENKIIDSDTINYLKILFKHEIRKNVIAMLNE